MQQDGTLQQILDQRPQLQQILSQVCGVGAPKEIDDTVRAALAESILMLVGSPVLYFQKVGSVDSCYACFAALSQGLACYHFNFAWGLSLL